MSLTIDECLQRIMNTGFQHLELTEEELLDFVTIIPAPELNSEPSVLKWGNMPIKIRKD